MGEFNPTWSAAQNGFPGNLDAENKSTQLNQLLGSHAITPVYQGSQVVTPIVGTQWVWRQGSNAIDFDQPFVMSGTSIGHVTVPVLPTGNGADLLITLCPDDGSGNPNTSAPVASTKIPASWITNLAASQGLANASSPLMQALYNTRYGTNSIFQGIPWGYPAGTVGGTAIGSGVATSDNYMVLAGGEVGGTTASSMVFIAQYAGGNVMNRAVAGPSLPQATNSGALALTSDTAVFVGGASASGAAYANVYTASWDPNAGQLGAWSLQAALPTALWSPAVAVDGETVYIVGGTNGTSYFNTVYYASVSGGQITAWQQATPYPTNIFSATCAVVGGYLVVAGGLLTSAVTSVTNAVYYAKIAADGSLGVWQTGTPLPLAVYAGNSGWNQVVCDNQLAIIGGNTGSGTTTDRIQMISVDSAGPAPTIPLSVWRQPVNSAFGAFADGTGSYEVIELVASTSLYYYSDFTPVPLVPVPFPVTGLTSGATYHWVLQTTVYNGTDGTDYLSIGTSDNNSYTTSYGNAQSRSRWSGAWTPIAAPWCVPIAVYNNAVNGTAPIGMWSDPASAGPPQETGVLLYSYPNRLVGVCEATLFANDPQNSNPTFVSGTSPWTAVNCTLTQSNTQVHGGYTESGLITPNGTSATVYAQSELIRVTPGQWYQAQGWLYSTPGWSSVSLSVNWFDGNQGYLSTSSHTVSLAAATWTQQVNNFQAPAGAAYATLVPTEGGTPSAAALLYLSYLTLTNADPRVLPSVAQVLYEGTNPLWPPTGVAQLA